MLLYQICQKFGRFSEADDLESFLTSTWDLKDVFEPFKKNSRVTDFKGGTLLIFRRE